MRPIRYSINVTLDGCVDHRAIPVDEEMHDHAAAGIEWADALLFGRVTYQLMEQGWRTPEADWPDALVSFAETMNAARKYVVSNTLDHVDWNTELLSGDLRSQILALKEEPGNGILLGGVALPLSLAELGLIDEYELVVHPRVAGHGPWLFDGLSAYVDLELVDRLDYVSGAAALRYRPRSRA